MREGNTLVDTVICRLFNIHVAM